MSPRWATTGVFVVNGAAIGTWVAQIPWIQERFGLSKSAMGLAIAGMSIAVILALPIAGQAVVRHGSERMVLLGEAPGMLAFLFTAGDDVVVEEDARGTLKDGAADVLDAAIAALGDLDDAVFSAEPIQAALREAIVDGLGVKPRLAFGPLRVAVSGRRISPPLFESMEILGREVSLSRLRALRASL